MNFKINMEKLEEMVLCIVDCDLNQDEALEYAKRVLLDFNDVENSEPVENIVYLNSKQLGDHNKTDETKL